MRVVARGEHHRHGVVVAGVAVEDDGERHRPLTIWSAPLPVPPRVLILSWEYPPIVEGGLARHVRKLSEQLVAQGTEVHVLTSGDRSPAGDSSFLAIAFGDVTEDRHGVTVHRVREPDFPKDDLDAFISWVDHMNDGHAAPRARS